MFSKFTAAASIVVACYGKTVSVSDFGAVGDGKVMNTKAFRSAASSLTEGGTLIVPSGQFLTGPFNLTSGTTLEVQGVVLGAQDMNEYPIIAPLPSYGISRDFDVYTRYQALVMTYNATNITIKGSSPTAAIDGQGSYWWKLRKSQSLQHGRPRLVELMGTKNITVTGIQLRDPGFWNLHPIYCEDVHIFNVNFSAPSSSPNTDGIDPDSSKNVLIEYNTFSVGDDMIAIKSGIDQYGREVNVPSENIIIRHNVMHAGHGVAIGSEVSGGVQNVHIYNNTIYGPAASALRIKTAPSRGGFIRNVLYENITIMDASTILGLSTVYKSSAPPAPVLTDIFNISYKSISRPAGSSGGHAGYFTCFEKPAVGCRNLQFEDIDIQGTTDGWSCQNVNSSVVHDVQPTGLSKCLSDS
eukprot:TRINITY_DN9360_c0_g1_i1.p1 TRINITY_DN9360_c0_g1~~TRINITY_DN9360_c0_g1_i1.p1  ORF type:complete len:435 (+),score=63.08 TRINITY_DN9360_c0_g1_i1:73-1305(+)